MSGLVGGGGRSAGRLVEAPRGGFSFLKAGFPFSAGAAAGKDYEIERARLARPLPIREGFAAIDQRLAALGRPPQSLCAIELRSPRPFTFDGFRAFNEGYVEYLTARDIHVDGVNPVARTNVAPAVAPPAEPSLYAFSYTVPAAGVSSTYVIAGAGEWPEGARDPAQVVRRGDTSPDAMREKARFVAGLMEGRLADFGVAWRDATATHVYTVHDIHPFHADEILARAGAAAVHGIVWHYARPPIETIEFEMDVRRLRREVVL